MPTEAAPFRFVVYGDTRTRHDMHRRVAAAVSKAEPDFVIHTGDLVSDGGDTALWPIFFSIEKELLRKTVFFPALGNHERNNRQFYEFFDVKSPYYSFNWGASHFVVLNTDIRNAAAAPDSRQTFWSEQTRWLEDDLRQNQKADHRFLICHHPPFRAVEKRKDDNQEVRQLVSLCEKYKVSVVFSGHDHNYQHHLKDGVHYVVTGGGGAPLHPVDGPIPEIARKVDSTEHFVQVKVDGKKAVLEAIGLDGRFIDRIELRP